MCMRGRCAATLSMHVMWQPLPCRLTSATWSLPSSTLVHWSHCQAVALQPRTPLPMTSPLVCHCCCCCTILLAAPAADINYGYANREQHREWCSFSVEDEHCAVVHVGLLHSRAWATGRPCGYGPLVMVLPVRPLLLPHSPYVLAL